jgi:hypothetical protein
MHIKIVVTALVAAILVVAIGIKAHVSDPAGAGARFATDLVIKAGRPAA